MVAGRALIAGAFFTTAAYLPLMLTSTHGWSLTAASAPLIVGSLGWSGASAWQGRHPDLSRARLLRVGFLGAWPLGLAALLLVAPTWGLAWLALPAVGRRRDRDGARASRRCPSCCCSDSASHGGRASTPPRRSLADQLSQAVFVGLGGALLALISTPAVALTVLVGVLAVLTVCGVAISPRTLRRLTSR